MMTNKRSAEKTVRDIRRATRRHYSAEAKIRIVLEGLRGGAALPNFAVEKASTEISITAGRKSFLRRVKIAYPATRIPRVP